MYDRLRMPASPVARPRFDWALIAILLLGLAFRLYRIDAPYVDAHSWRQVTNADIARHWVEQPIQFGKPVVSWGGPDGRVGLEFPLLHLVTALVWRLTGVDDAAGRLVAVAFSLPGIFWLAHLGRRLFGRPAGLAAAFVLAVSPSVVYFGRTLLSDTPMLSFSIGAVLGFVAYAQTGRWTHALGGAVCLALAGLVKIPAILVLGPVLWAGLLRDRWRILNDPWFVAAPLAALGIVAVWYLHADVLYQATGLTQAIFRPSGTYPGEIGALAGPFVSVSHWTRPEQLSWEVFRDLGVRFWTLHLTPVFAVAAVAGMALARGLQRTVVDVWMAAALSLLLVSLNGQIFHEFHQLPLLPPLALYAGVGLAPLFDAARFATLGRWRYAAGTAAATLAVAAALWGFVESNVTRDLYRVDLMNTPLIDAGAAIDSLTPKDALLVTMEYERNGANSPMLLYYAHRRGWSFDATSLSIDVIEFLHRQRGACYFATSEIDTLARVRPEIGSYLDGKRRVELPGIMWRFQLYDLGCVQAPPG